MKKILSLFLSSLMLSAFYSCGEIEESNEVETIQQATEVTTEEITTEAKTEVKTEPETEAEIMTEAEAGESTEPQTEDPWAKFDYVCRDKYTEPINVWNDDNLSISCQGWAIADDIFSAKFEIENKMDRNINVKTENTSINDYDIDIYLYDDITAGKKKMLYAQASSKELQQCSLSGKDINHVEFRFRIKDEDTYETLFETDAIPIDIVQE